MKKEKWQSRAGCQRYWTITMVDDVFELSCIKEVGSLLVCIFVHTCYHSIMFLFFSLSLPLSHIIRRVFLQGWLLRVFPWLSSSSVHRYHHRHRSSDPRTNRQSGKKHGPSFCSVPRFSVSLLSCRPYPPAQIEDYQLNWVVNLAAVSETAYTLLDSRSPRDYPLRVSGVWINRSR